MRRISKTKLKGTLVIGAVVLLCEMAFAAGYDIAAYVWPAYQPEPRWAELGIFGNGKGEWQSVYEAIPKWEGHEQPRKPLWGYGNEANPEVVEKKIEAAVTHGVNVFIYDWYWYCGRPFLEDALNQGFLGAPNNHKMKFFIMWANHDVDQGWDNKISNKSKDGYKWLGTVTPEVYRELVARWIKLYFTRPNYYRIDGKTVFMVYDILNFVKTFGTVEKAAKGIEYLREECRKAGLGGVHFMVCDYQINPEWIKALGIDSATIYNYVHWSSPKGNPDYSDWARKASERFDEALKITGYPIYFAHVSVGWDQNPRYPEFEPMPTVLNSTPAKFEQALYRAKEWCDRNTPEGCPRLITVNSWNEWTEGSYLEPDEKWGYGYLEAIEKVFSKNHKKEELK